MFLDLSNSKGHGSEINLYDKDDFNIIKTFLLDRLITFISYDKNKDIIIFISLNDKTYLYFYIYNIKYYEIIQEFEYEKVNDSFLLMNNQFTFEVFYNHKKNQIQINKYSIEKGCFIDYRSLKEIGKLYISLTNDNYVFIQNEYVFIIYNILEKENYQEEESQSQKKYGNISQEKDKYKQEFHQWFIRHSIDKKIVDNKNEKGKEENKDTNLNGETKNGELKKNNDKYENWFIRHSRD